MEHPPERLRDADDESLARIVSRRAVRRLREDAGTPEFGRLLAFQATQAAGDFLLALALAGSLFFSVPTTEAREKVALYLFLTVAPFAVVAPLLSRALDGRRGSLRIAMILSSVGRGLLAWLLVDNLDSLYLYPIAFGILVLSRASLVVRGAVLPQLVPEGRPLVNANATLSKIGAIAGVVAAPIGLALVKWPGVRTELTLTALVYAAGAIPALRVPRVRGRRALREREEARLGARSLSVRQALVAIGGMRFLVGFLVFHLAFALRREDFGSFGLGLLLGAATLGSLIGALLAPRLKAFLREEGILVACLFVAGMAGLVVGRWFSLVAAGVLAFVFAVASGAAKVSFDSIVQRETPEAARGWAFARFEAGLQLAWVAGAAVPVAIAIPSGPGVAGAGALANLLALLYTFGRLRVRSRDRT